MSEEEKELTLEEMKSLVSLATLLPALLEKISAINKDVGELKASFNDIKIKFTANANVISGYKESVDELIKKQPDFKQFEKDLDAIKTKLDLLSPLDKAEKNNLDLNEKKTISASKILLKKQKPVDEDREKVIEIVDKILASRRGRKTRVLTTVDIKTGFKVDDVIAVKVIKWFQDNKMYNDKLHLLTFPKN